MPGSEVKIKEVSFRGANAAVIPRFQDAVEQLLRWLRAPAEDWDMVETHGDWMDVVSLRYSEDMQGGVPNCIITLRYDCPVIGDRRVPWDRAS